MSHAISRKWLPTIAAVLLAAAASLAAAADRRSESTVRLPEEQVIGERPIAPFLPPVQGTTVYDGKKTTVTSPDDLPKIVNENYRQLLYRTPSLLLSEETTPLLSLGYRGLDPHRAQFTQVLKDGIPIHADMFGYPEAYYTPPFAALDRIEFLRGGASLLYGPQPGGALNFVTRDPPVDRRFSLRSDQTFGSYDFYSTYDAVGGTVDRVGYYSYFYHRRGDGFRESNSDFEQFAGSAKAVLDADSDSRWTLNFDGYAEEHGEPGGLRKTPAENAALYSESRTTTTRPFDRFRLERYVPWLRWERECSDDTMLQLTSWGGYYSRFSRRQRGGGFGTLPSGEAARTNSIELQEFYTFGADARARHHWQWVGNTHTLTAGMTYYRVDSPRVDKRGSRPDAGNGAMRNRSDRMTNYYSLFAEQRLVLGKLSIIPAGRLENIWQSIDEKVNADKAAAGVPLDDVDDHDFEPLVGLGLVYAFWPSVESYANVSSAYRPKLYTQAFSTSPTTIVAGNIQPGSSWQYEIGFRGDPAPWIYWDTSLFLLDFSDQIGTISQPEGPNIIDNVGHSRHKGWEGATELYVTELHDVLRGGDLADRFGSLSVYGTVMLLDAEFEGGPFEGNTPQYAPDYLARTGLRYDWSGRIRAALLGTFVDEHFSDDNNNRDRSVPRYDVWDLTFEANVHRDTVAVHFGINNLFNERYYARVRGDGIDPAMGRNFYGGFRLYL